MTTPHLHYCLTHPFQVVKVHLHLRAVSVNVKDSSSCVCRLGHQWSHRPSVLLLVSDLLHVRIELQHTVTRERGRMICITKFDGL